MPVASSCVRMLDDGLHVQPDFPVLMIRGRKYHCPLCGETVTVEFQGGLVPTPAHPEVFTEQTALQERFEDALYAHDADSICQKCMDRDESLYRSAAKAAQLIGFAESACDTVRLLKIHFRRAFSDMAISHIRQATTGDFKRLAPRLFSRTIRHASVRGVEAMVTAYLDMIDPEATAEAYLVAQGVTVLSILWRKTEIAVRQIMESVDAIVYTLSGRICYHELNTRRIDAFGPDPEHRRNPVAHTREAFFFFPMEADRKVEDIVKQSGIAGITLVDDRAMKRHMRKRLLQLLKGGHEKRAPAPR